MKSQFEEFRNNVFCRHESNQRKAWDIWMEIRDQIPEKERLGFSIEWSHYELGEFSPDEFGKEIKKIEPYFL